MPPSPADRAPSRRVNRSKTSSRCSGGIPGPSSVTATTAVVAGSADAQRHRRAGVADGVVDAGCRRPAPAGPGRRSPGRRRRRGCRPGPGRRPARRRTWRLDHVVEVDRDRPPRAAAPASLRASASRSSTRRCMPDRLVEDAAAGGRPDRRSRGGPGRPRSRSGCGRAGCAARGRRRPRTAAGGGRRPRSGRAWRSWCGPAGRPRRRSAGPGPAGRAGGADAARPRARIASTGRSVRPTSSHTSAASSQRHRRDGHGQRPGERRRALVDVVARGRRRGRPRSPVRRGHHDEAAPPRRRRPRGRSVRTTVAVAGRRRRQRRQVRSVRRGGHDVAVRVEHLGDGVVVAHGVEPVGQACRRRPGRPAPRPGPPGCRRGPR